MMEYLSFKYTVLCIKMTHIAALSGALLASNKVSTMT